MSRITFLKKLGGSMLSVALAVSIGGADLDTANAQFAAGELAPSNASTSVEADAADPLTAAVIAPSLSIDAAIDESALADKPAREVAANSWTASLAKGQVANAQQQALAKETAHAGVETSNATATAWLASATFEARGRAGQEAGIATAITA